MSNEDYDEEEVLSEKDESAVDEELEAAEVASEILVGGDAEDLFVEVGDRVVFFFADKPDEKLTVMIVDSQSNPKMGLVNEEAPLACALLGASVGETTNLAVAGHSLRPIHVVKIQRQEELL